MQAQTEVSGTISLEAGEKYDIQLLYEEIGGDAVVILSWSADSVPKQVRIIFIIHSFLFVSDIYFLFQVIPTSQLYPLENGLLGYYYSDSSLTNLVGHEVYFSSLASTLYLLMFPIYLFTCIESG